MVVPPNCGLRSSTGSCVGSWGGGEESVRGGPVGVTLMSCVYLSLSVLFTGTPTHWCFTSMVISCMQVSQNVWQANSLVGHSELRKGGSEEGRQRAVQCQSRHLWCVSPVVHLMCIALSLCAPAFAALLLLCSVIIIGV